MIYTEKITINGKAFVKTWSDTSMVERDGVAYHEAIDPADSGRTYTEGGPKMETDPEEGQL